MKEQPTQPAAAGAGRPGGARRRAGRPRDGRADRAIIAAALELMARRGVHALRMDEVAVLAGVGKATVYRRYSSRDELVIAAVGALVNEIEIPDLGSAREDLLAVMTEAVSVYDGSLAGRLMPTVVDEMSRNPDLARVARDGFLTGRRAALGAIFRRGVLRGELRSDIDLELALDVLAGPLFYRLLISGGPIDRRLALGTVELILRGFAPPDGPPSGTPTGKEVST